MTKATTKDVHVSLPNKDHLQFFIEVISKALEHVEFILNYKQGGIRVRLFGERETVLQSVGIVKTFGKMITNSVIPDNEGYYSHNLRIIQQISTKIVSLDSLSAVLHYSGVSAYQEGQELITKADMKQVQEVLEELLEILQDTPLNIRSQAMKKVILTVSYCTNYEPSFVISQGLEYNLFQYQRDSVAIAESPEKCIEDLIEKLSEENAKENYDNFKENRKSNVDFSLIR
ncbi:MAG: DUF2067 family protein [Candidatus Heimdallarchaeota archaeon]|nr:DUF2067 family protein [Candidatus Heimdallarchaeota archaeon]